LGTFPKNEYQFSLIDSTGKVVLSQVVTDAPLVKGFAVGQLARGMYMAVMESDSTRVTRKIVLE
jgi:hypothetical protein